MLRLVRDVKLADGPRGSGLCYWPKEGKTIEVNSTLYVIAKHLRFTSYSTIKELASKSGRDQEETTQIVDALIDLSILEQVNENAYRSEEEGGRRLINIKRVDRYKYYLGEVARLKALKYAFEVVD